MHGTDEIVNAHYRGKTHRDWATLAVIVIVAVAILFIVYLDTGFWASAGFATVVILAGCWIVGWARARIDLGSTKTDDLSSK